MDWVNIERKQREIEGEIKYGVIDPKNDSRCFIDEMKAELLDALNYLQWSMEKGEINLCNWYLVDQNIRFTISLLKIKQ